jgi:hypothetical protein
MLQFEYVVGVVEGLGDAEALWMDSGEHRQPTCFGCSFYIYSRGNCTHCGSLVSP